MSMIQLTRDAVAEAVKNSAKSMNREIVWKTGFGYVGAYRNDKQVFVSDWMDEPPTELTSDDPKNSAIDALAESGKSFGVFSASGPDHLGEIFGISLDCGTNPIMITLPLVDATNERYIREELAKFHLYGRSWLK